MGLGKNKTYYILVYLEVIRRRRCAYRSYWL